MAISLGTSIVAGKNTSDEAPQVRKLLIGKPMLNARVGKHERAFKIQRLEDGCGLFGGKVRDEHVRGPVLGRQNSQNQAEEEHA